MEGGEEVKCYCLEGDSFSFFCLLAPHDSASDPLGLKQSLGILPTLILPAYRSTMLTACVFVTRDTVRHPRRLVLGKFVRKPNCSLSDAFVNRGLTVLPSTTTIMHILQINNNTFQ